eukprot:TRINITY_DN5547_c0_g2_i1.p1 TRINITY_DN5547_c0_g2~~TRINITY_DN5547_c0_g2_i1.p1  ORF type:complete len:451 (+),score=96.32 TRINITY_DN5547_c0_g2_i1:69-1355(+)
MSSSETTAPTPTPTTIVSGLSPTIISPADLEEFHASKTYEEFLNFIIDLNNSVKGVTLSTQCTLSPSVSCTLEILESLSVLVDDTPPLPHRTRFGNEAFVSWHQKLCSNSIDYMNKILKHSPLTKQQTQTHETNEQDSNDESYDIIGIFSSDSITSISKVVNELVDYFTHSFGDPTRIDYGSGHEAHFVAWMLCLYKLKIFAQSDFTPLVIVVFNRYISLMRKLQTVYWLEPAGSHGVWGLDDYHFLPFLWGSSQLINHKYIHPKSIRNMEIVSVYAKDYMYLECIKFINKVKTGSFVEHSPMLMDISGVKNWNKVNEGMIKMYKAELLSKLPVMQHFRFGTLLPFTPTIKDEEYSHEHDHTHHHHHVSKIFATSSPQTNNSEKMPQSCGCAIRIPSSIAASEGAKNQPRPFIAFDWGKQNVNSFLVV